MQIFKADQVKVICCYFLLYVLASQSHFAQANTKYLLLDGGADSRSNYFRYYGEARRGYETLKSIKADVQIMAKDGYWKTIAEKDESASDFALTPAAKAIAPLAKYAYPAYPPITSPLRSADDIEKQISAMKLKSGDSLVMFITSHGAAPVEAGNPASATIELWGVSLRYDELEAILAKVSPTVSIKIATSICYGGGIHALSRKLSNVCTSAVSAYYQPSQSGNLVEGQFSQGFWKQIQQTNGKTTFAEANIAGFYENNANNPGQARLSSFDYVDYVLKTGPYEKNYAETPSTPTSTNVTGRYYPLPPHYSTPISPDYGLGADGYESLDSKNCQALLAGFDKDIKDLSDVGKILNNLLRLDQQNEMQNTINKQPAGLKNIFQKAIDDLKSNSAVYRSKIVKFDKEYLLLKKKWDDLPREPEGKDNLKTRHKRVKIQKDFEKLKAESAIELKNYFLNHELVARLKTLDQFSIKATAEQKKKFLDLQNCEWAQL